MQATERVNVLGIGISAITMSQALAIIEEWIVQRERHYVCVTDVHSVMESQRDENLRRIHNTAGLVTPDGMPLVWFSHLRGSRHVERVYGPDLMLALAERSIEKGYRHFLYGGRVGVPERLAQNLTQWFPGLNIAGTYSPPFHTLTGEEELRTVQMINVSNADIVWVGLGNPKQEYWMKEHLGKVAAPVMIGVGAAFDFHSGLKKQAPRWIQRSGFEWLYRFMTEPRRLGKRYLVNNPLFLWLILLQSLGIKRYRLE